ncbi:MAG: ATP-binding protein [Bacteroidales bacterium]|nr:ATP-binding protein [Bacteroidales bacterium]
MALLYPIGMQNFPNIVNRGYAYVDKTALIYQLTHTFAACFLSRPRRFGKSLLLSTMEAYFRGRRELFKGLAIEELEKDWTVHPVIHIDLNNGNFGSKERLSSTLEGQITKLERDYGITNPLPEIGQRFGEIIRVACEATGQQVVVLIDEYDKPMLEIMTDEEAQKEYRQVLKPFYGTLKASEQYLRFIFITGVTKFAKLSVFSDLNQLKDISLLPDYDTLCGITTQEMIQYFGSGVEAFAQAKGWTVDETIAKLEHKYDGYHFSSRKTGVLNPFSLLNALSDKDLEAYWFATGTPTFLARLMERHHTPADSLVGYKATSELLTSVESVRTNPIPVIYQSGYLTIKDYDEATRRYTLGFPNEEVEQGFLNFLLPYYVKKEDINSSLTIEDFVEDFRDGKAEDMLKRVQSLFADVNFELVLDTEAHYKNVLYIVFKLIGLQVEVERHTSQGSIDMVVKTDRYVYIIEFKYKGTAKKAIDQIIDRGYALPYQCDPRTVLLIGASFSPRTRTLSSRWIIQPLKGKA